MKKNKTNNILKLFGILIFAYIFVSIPYESIRGESSFVDLDNYVQTFSGKSYVLKKAGGSLKGYISNEVLWDKTVRSLMQWFDLSPLQALTGISYFTILVMALYVKRGAGWLWMFLLFNPLLVDFVMSQCRLAFAMGLFYLALLMSRKVIVLVASIAAIFIHTAMIPLTAFYWGSWWLYKKSFLKKYPRACLCGIVSMAGLLVLLMGPLQGLLGSAFSEDRRVGRYVGASTSYAYSSFWVALLAFLNINPKFNNRPNNAFTTILLCVFTGTVVFDLYGSRFIALSLPCIICAVRYLKDEHKKIVVPVFVAYVSVQWMYWLKLV